MMSFTKQQKQEFCKKLLDHNWRLENGLIVAPSGGLWFDDSHFEMWGPKEMADIFEKRAERIRKSKIGEWEQISKENHEVFKVIMELELCHLPK